MVKFYLMKVRVAWQVIHRFGVEVCFLCDCSVNIYIYKVLNINNVYDIYIQ